MWKLLKFALLFAKRRLLFRDFLLHRSERRWLCFTTSAGGHDDLVAEVSDEHEQNRKAENKQRQRESESVFEPVNKILRDRGAITLIWIGNRIRLEHFLAFFGIYRRA